MAQTSDSGDKKTGKDSAEKKPAQAKDMGKGPSQKCGFQVAVGNVEVTVLKATRGAPPAGAKTKDAQVLIVQVKLNLKEGATKNVELKSWMDESFQNKVSLKDKDDQNKSYDLLDQVPADKDNDGKTITEKWMKLDLVFEVARQEREVPATETALCRLPGRRARARV